MYSKAQLYAHMQPVHATVGSWVYGNGETDKNYNRAYREEPQRRGKEGGEKRES